MTSDRFPASNLLSLQNLWFVATVLWLRPSQLMKHLEGSQDKAEINDSFWWWHWQCDIVPSPPPPPKKTLLGSHSMRAPLQRQLALNKSNDCWNVHTLHFLKSADHSAPPEGCWGLPGQHSAWPSSCWTLSNTTQLTSQTSQGKEGHCIELESQQNQKEK